MATVAKRTIVLILVLLTGWPLPASAAAAPGDRVTISPFLQNISVTTADTTKSFQLEVSNESQSIQEIDLSTRDFGSLNDTGGVLLLGTNSQYGRRYGLTSWLSLESDTVVLNPGEKRQVAVSVNNRDDLQPGGHYAAVVAAVKNLDEDNGNHVAINQQLLSLVLVTKQGGERYNLKLAELEQNGNWLHLPSTVKLHFQNPGNVHVTPRGLVSLKSPTGKVLATGIINTESAYVLPGSFRDLYVKLTPTGRDPQLPGLYRIEVKYRYDGLEAVATKHYAVRFINLPMFVLLIVLLVVIFRSRLRLIRALKKLRRNR